MAKVAKKKVVARKRLEPKDTLNFGKGARLKVDLGVSLAVPTGGQLDNIFVCRPSLELDCAPNEIKITQALEYAGATLDAFIAPRIEDILKKQLGRRKKGG